MGRAVANDERVPLYDAHEWIFNARDAWTLGLDDLKLVARMLYGLFAVGTVPLKRAIVAGQYHRPHGLFYGGGPKMAASHALLLPLLRKVATPASAAIIIDVHTGLGPQGVDTLIPPFPPRNATSAAANAKAIHGIWGAAAQTARPTGGLAGGRDGEVHQLGTDFLIEAPTVEEAAGVSTGYELTRGSTESPEGYTARVGGGPAGWARALAVCQEFGTRPFHVVMRAMIFEAAEWRHRGGASDTAPPTSGECRGSAMGAKTLRDAFYVRKASWQRSIVHRGVRVVEQAVRALTEEPTIVPSL